MTIVVTPTRIAAPARRPAPGPARIVVENRTARPIRFVIGGRETPLIPAHAQRTLLLTLLSGDSYTYRVAGTKLHGTLKVMKRRGTQFALQPVGTFDTPDFLTAPPGDTHRLFVVEQPGVIRQVVDGKILPAPFLDLSSDVHFDDEDGMLSMVFAPDYATSGRFYIYYNDRDGTVRLVENRTLPGDPQTVDLQSARQVLFIAKPYSNHNGSMMQFGPDGYLYVSVGDGDAGVKNKPGAFAQTLNDLLGDILRIDPLHGDTYTVPAGNPFVGTPGARPEIWDYGFRTPWRFWIDPPTGDMYIGDVQLGGPEEIDYVAHNTGGLNFGWPCFQGTVPFDATATCPDPVPPIAEYGHDGGPCAVIGGVTVHDPSLPALAGYYVYGDLCTGEISALKVVDGKATDVHALPVTLPGLDSFGVDGAGHVYLMATSGEVARLTQP